MIQSRAESLAALERALKTLGTFVPQNTEVMCLVLALGGNYIHFGACDAAMFDPTYGELDDIIEFVWEHEDKNLLESIQRYRRCRDRLPIDDALIEMKVWDAKAMQLLKKHERGAPFRLRLVHDSELRRETLERYGLLRKRSKRSERSGG